MERAFGVAAALGLMAAMGGQAEARADPRHTAEAVLAAAPAGETRTIIDGRVWKCLGSGCRGVASAAPKSQPALHECQRVAAVVGELALYRTGGRVLDSEALARCNTAAAPRTGGGELAQTQTQAR